jgi:hypothetical protein
MNNQLALASGAGVVGAIIGWKLLAKESFFSNFNECFTSIINDDLSLFINKYGEAGRDTIFYMRETLNRWIFKLYYLRSDTIYYIHENLNRWKQFFKVL